MNITARGRTRWQSQQSASPMSVTPIQQPSTRPQDDLGQRTGQRSARGLAPTTSRQAAESALRRREYLSRSPPPVASLTLGLQMRISLPDGLAPAAVLVLVDSAGKPFIKHTTDSPKIPFGHVRTRFRASGERCTRDEPRRVCTTVAPHPSRLDPGVGVWTIALCRGDFRPWRGRVSARAICEQSKT